MSVRSMLGAARRKVLPNRYYRDPQAYWEQRHAAFGDSAEGSGRLHMTDADNQANYDEKWSHIREALDLVGERGDLLDAGCGIGLFTQRFVDLGFTVTAIDFTQTGIDLAKEAVEGDVAWVVSDLAGFRPGRTYPLVACIDVTFHIVDDAAWLAAAQNLGRLAAGGLLVVQDHLVDEPEPAPDPTAGVVHTRWRTLDDWQRALGDAELVHHDHYLLPIEQATKDVLAFRVPPQADLA